MSTSTRTYLSTVTKNPVLMSTLRVLLSTFLNFKQIGKKLIVSQALPHLFQMPLTCLFSDLKKQWPHLFFGNKNVNKKTCLPHLFFIKVALEFVYFLAIFLYLEKVYFTYQAYLGYCGHIDFFINNELDERPNDAYNWPGATLFWITIMYLN